MSNCIVCDGRGCEFCPATERRRTDMSDDLINIVHVAVGRTHTMIRWADGRVALKPRARTSHLEEDDQ